MAIYVSGSGPQFSAESVGSAQSEVLPVLVDGTGRRRRRVRVAAAAVGTACTAYVCTLILSLAAGNVNPFGLPPFGGTDVQIQPLPDGRGAQPDGLSAGERDAAAGGAVPTILGFAAPTTFVSPALAAGPTGVAGG